MLLSGYYTISDLVAYLQTQPQHGVIYVGGLDEEEEAEPLKPSNFSIRDAFHYHFGPTHVIAVDGLPFLFYKEDYGVEGIIECSEGDSKETLLQLIEDSGASSEEFSERDLSAYPAIEIAVKY